MRSKVYSHVGGLRPGRSAFDLSYEKKFTCDMGKLIPILCEEVVPGDKFVIGNQIVIRFQPLVAPILHQIDVYVHYFFVPNRIMWPETVIDDELDGWETFITGGVSGDLTPVLPKWEPTDTTEGSLWDYMGFPSGVDPDGFYPVDFPRIAYNMVYNEYYRDNNLQDEIDLDNETILNRNWTKDYFTSALLEQQRGTAPALPISGTTSAVWASSAFLNTGIATDGFTAVGADSAVPGQNKIRVYNSTVLDNMQNAMNDNTVDLSVASTFDIADLRLAFQIQKWMERNNRAGARYTEFLQAHYGTHPRDDRLQRPEYIGGSKSPIIISEVLQTSESGTTDQGNMAGHGISVSQGYCGKFYAPEFGVVIGIMSVMPKPAYQQGINRQWIKFTKYDYYSPEFANLSEQEIYRGEIYASNVDTENLTLFGYQGRYDELRTKQDMVCGQMRSTYDYWHMGREFLSAPELNSTFITCNPRKDIFAAQDEPGLIVSFGNLIKAIRPIPIMAEPGLIDHN